MSSETHANTVQKVLHHTAEHAATSHGAHEAHELPNWITLLNKHFPDNALVHFLHQWENIVFAAMIASIISFFAVRAARKKNMVPTPLQNFCESVVEGLDGFVSGILGSHGRQHLPFIGTVFIYVLLMNWSGLIPLSKSPTAAWSTTLALALTTMVYVQIAGIRSQGLWHYLKHLAGNPQNVFGVILIPLMLVLNLILEIGAVPFSLSLRLFANISSEDRLLLNFAELAVSTHYIAFPFQLFANILAIIFSIIQAFVFMLLTTVYIALVLPHEDHGHEEKSDFGHAHS